MNAMEAVMHLGQWGQTHMQEVVVGMLAVPVLAGVAAALRSRRQPASTVHGSARWATWREIKQAGVVGETGVVLGRVQGQLLCDNGEAHVLLLGATGSGKGTAVIIPTLLCWQGSALVLDPSDGENCEVTAPWRAQQGTVAVFRPHVRSGVQLNVCDLIRFGTPHEFGDALAIGQSHTAPEKMAHESQTSLHFRELAAMLHTAAQLHVHYATGRCSMGRVWHFLTQEQQSLAGCLKAMAGTAHTSHGVHQAIVAMTTALKNISGDRELGSIWSTAIRPLLLYNDPYIAQATETSTVQLSELQGGSKPVALYLCAPSPRALQRLHPLYRAITDITMLRLMECRPYSWRHRLLVVADEAPLYGYTTLLDTDIAFMRKYGMKALIVAQDTVMLEDVFGKNTALWGNTTTKIVQAQANDLTAKRLSENLLGRQTVEHSVESRQGGIVGQRSVSHQHVGRALLTADEMLELPPGERAVVRVIGCKPFQVQQVDYRSDPFFQRRVA